MDLAAAVAERAITHVTVEPQPDGGWAVVGLRGTEIVTDERFAPAVDEIEREHSPRWVWRSTARTYRRLVEQGVRVARCHDLGLTERLLLGHEGRWSAWSTCAEADLAGQGGADARGVQLSLLDEADGAAARHLDQMARIAAARTRHGGIPLLVAAESAGALAAVEMTLAGLPWDVAAHDAILTALLGPRTRHGRPPLLQALADDLAAVLDDPRVNPDSPADLLRSLRRAGLPVSSTNRHELARHEHPAIPLARRYKELARLWTAHGWAWQEAWVHGGRFHPEYVPGGVVSGRWASRGGGALQIPKAVRGAVRAPAGRVLVVADAGQLEPRVLAALSGDAGMIAATAAGDLYAELAARALGRPDARAEAKIALLSAMYGGGSGSPALAALRRRFPRALGLLEDAARAGEDGATVHSVLGRVCPPPRPEWLDGLNDTAAGARTRARGRFTRNFVVQASAADWAAVLVATLRTHLADLPAIDGWAPRIVFFQHDEVMVESAADQAAEVIRVVAHAGAEATRLVFGETGVSIPLAAAAVTSYADKP